MVTLLWAVAVALLRYGEAVLSTQLRLLDLEGREVDPFQQTDARATVFLFTRTDCPISNRYAPEILGLQAKFQSDNVPVLARVSRSGRIGESPSVNM